MEKQERTRTRQSLIATVLASTLLIGAGCQDRQEADRTIGEDVAGADTTLAGDCAVEVKSGALIGRIVGIGTNPEDGERAYRVQLETDPRDTVYVGLGTDRVDCAAVRDQTP